MSSWIISSNSTGYPNLLCVTAITSSLVSFGKSSSIFRELSWNSVPVTTPKQMGNRSGQSMFVSTQPKQWSKWLPYMGGILVQDHLSYIDKNDPLVGYEAGTSTVTQVDNTLASWDNILRTLKQHLAEAQNHMKQQVDQHQIEREFKEGDIIFLHLQPYRESSIASRRSMKLAPQFYGPFWVLQWVGNVAYRLDHPPKIYCLLSKTSHGLNLHPGTGLSILWGTRRTWGNTLSRPWESTNPKENALVSNIYIFFSS